MSPTKILFIAHGHPEVQMGGAEVHAYELFGGFRDRPGYEATFLARTHASGYAEPSSTPFRAFEDRDDEILWYESPGGFDWMQKSLHDKSRYTVHFRRLLRDLEPDIVHIQHLDGLGLDVVRECRRSLPDVPIVYTLHELQAICHANGLMIRPDNQELCDRASPVRCHRCFPDVAPVSFVLRRQLLLQQLRHVDLFLAPSEFLRSRYIEWGIPEERIRFEDYGRTRRAPPAEVEEPPTNWFGFFGQIAPHKGLLVLLKAARLLVDSGFDDFHVFINGSNLEQQREDFQRDFRLGLEDTRGNVTFLGSYRNEEVGQRMRDLAWVVVPSIWWENSPLVIQEAFINGRPVLCSDIGGMAEKVRDGVDGLHFRVGDPADLADRIRQAAGSSAEWRRLRSAIRPIYSLDETLEQHAEIYRSLVDSPVVA